jgi:hypothetical protein
VHYLLPTGAHTSRTQHTTCEIGFERWWTLKGRSGEWSTVVKTNSRSRILELGKVQSLWNPESEQSSLEGHCGEINVTSLIRAYLNRKGLKEQLKFSVIMQV